MPAIAPPAIPAYIKVKNKLKAALSFWFTMSRQHSKLKIIVIKLTCREDQTTCAAKGKERQKIRTLEDS